MDRRANVVHAVLAIRGLLEPLVPAYALKRRDRREPARREKEEADDALTLFLLRHFKKQARLLRERMETVKVTPYIDDIFDQDEEEIADLVRLLTRNTRNGINLFGQSTGVTIDYSMTNLQAAEWARRYAGKLIKDIDAHSLEIVRQAVAQFVETPGFTLRDLMDLLPYDEKRAQNIAVTEVTRTYAQGQIMAGEELRDQFPDVRVMKQWFTNMDDLVCDLCGPLDGVEVGIDEPFYESGSDYEDGDPPLHVNCRCWISTYTTLGEENA